MGINSKFNLNNNDIVKDDVFQSVTQAYSEKEKIRVLPTDDMDINVNS